MVPGVEVAAFEQGEDAPTRSLLRVTWTGFGCAVEVPQAEVAYAAKVCRNLELCAPCGFVCALGSASS